VITRGQYGHSAAVGALLAAERRGLRHPAAGTRGRDSTRSPSLAGALGGAHNPSADDGDADGGPLQQPPERLNALDQTHPTTVR
jgi:hypothetical protein